MSSRGRRRFQKREHFKECCIYQVYPASFCDSNDDGIGDIQGMISKLDYLVELGIDAVWLSPVYQSPFVDNGYDISDYQEIHPQFGTMADMDVLIKEMHARGIKLIMDLVVNHTSDQHEWFIQSRKSKDNPFRAFYHWQPPKYDADGKRCPPNNWREEFSNGSAWEWDETTQEYYLHLYCKEQPDLNWESEKMRKAVYEDIMKWWLDRGADGFRMDVINLISKAPGYPEASIQDPGEAFQWPYEHCANGPRIHEYLQEMNREVLSNYPGCITVGETPFTHHDFDVLVPYVLPENKELQMIFQFEQQEVDGYPQLIPRNYTLHDFKTITSRWQLGMQEKGGWNSIYIENHDVARSVSRFGDTSTPQFRSLTAKLLSLMQCTLTGTLFVYQGEEIGMANLPKDWSVEEYKDVMSQTYWREELAARRAKQAVDHPNMSDIMDGLQRKARDHARNPMQWDSSAHGGFTSASATPWMRVHDDHIDWNAKSQRDVPTSVFGFWKKMLAFRKKHLSCTYGWFTHLAPEHKEVFAYTKEHDSEKMLVLLNFTNRQVMYELPESWPSWISVQIGNYEGELESTSGTITLRPYEGVAVVQ